MVGTKIIIGAVIAGLLLAVLAPTAITALADMDTDGTSNNSEFTYLAAFPALAALFLLLGGGYAIGKKFGLV